MPNSACLTRLPSDLIWLCIFISLSFAFTGDSFAIGNTVLSDYSLRDSATDTKLVIRFQQPINYRTHFPQSTGRRIEIGIQRLLTKGSGVNNEIRDILPIKKKDKSILIDNIRYEESNRNNGLLLVELSRTLQYTLIPGNDNRSIIITIAKPGVRQQLDSAENLEISSKIYVIKLYTSSKPIDPDNHPALAKYARHKYDIYVTTSKSNQKIQYHLYLGYYLSSDLARQNIANLKSVYPNARLYFVNKNRLEIARQWFMSRQMINTKSDPGITRSETKLGILYERGKQAMIDRDYSKAISHFTKILQYKDTPYHKDSLELLGLARERNNQLAHAKAEYQKYLKLYPKDEDAERVKQRLRGLLTARSKPKEKLGTNNNPGDKEDWEIFGSFSQFYRRQINETDITPSITTESSLASDIVISGRKKGLDWSQRFDFVANHYYSFLSGVDANDGKIYTLFYDLSNKDNDLDMRLGRQTHSSDGVLGRFDGLIVKKRIGNNKRINLLAGYPVELSLGNSIRTNRQFYAVSMDFESIFNKTDLKLYYIEQTNDVLTDRKAVGTELQYIDDFKSLFMLIDYDTFYNKLNQATLVGNWRYKDKSNLNIVADSRSSPLLTTNNALIGQTAGTIEELRQTYLDSEIYQFARDRTADFDSLTIGYSNPITDKYQINTDITVSSLNSTITSGGVDGTPGTGNEYFFNIALLINGLFTDNDITVAGIRYSDASTSETTSANFSSRFSLNKNWRLNPRLNVDLRSDDNGSERTTYKSRLIINYRSKQNLKYDLELGYENSETTTGSVTSTDKNYYLYIGYIYDF